MVGEVNVGRGTIIEPVGSRAWGTHQWPWGTTGAENNAGTWHTLVEMASGETSELVGGRSGGDSNRDQGCNLWWVHTVAAAPRKEPASWSMVNGCTDQLGIQPLLEVMVPSPLPLPHRCQPGCRLR